MEMDVPHSKCPFGQALYPCNPQGLQANVDSLWAMMALSDNGPNPNSGMVEQKNAVTGALVAEHKWSGPESFT
jgi:hypothetical protein